MRKAAGLGQPAHARGAEPARRRAALSGGRRQRAGAVHGDDGDHRQRQAGAAHPAGRRPAAPGGPAAGLRADRLERAPLEFQAARKSSRPILAPRADRLLSMAIPGRPGTEWTAPSPHAPDSRRFAWLATALALAACHKPRRCAAARATRRGCARSPTAAQADSARAHRPQPGDPAPIRHHGPPPAEKPAGALSGRRRRAGAGPQLLRPRAFELALACSARACADAPDSADAHAERAADSWRSGRLEEAQLAFARALALEPDHLDALLGAVGSVRDPAPRLARQRRAGAGVRRARAQAGAQGQAGRAGGQLRARVGHGRRTTSAGPRRPWSARTRRSSTARPRTTRSTSGHPRCTSSAASARPSRSS